MTSRHGHLRLPAFLIFFVSIGFLCVWGCGDDTSTGPGLGDPTRITMQLTAIVETVSDANNVLAGFIEVGDTISGTYIYDSTVEDSNPADTTVGSYWHDSAPYGIFLEIKGYEFKTDLNDVLFGIQISDDFVIALPFPFPPYDECVVISNSNAPVTFNVAVDQILFGLSDGTATALSSDELTTSPPDLADWSVKVLMIEGHSISQPSYTFHISGEVSEISKVQ